MHISGKKTEKRMFILKINLILEICIKIYLQIERCFKMLGLIRHLGGMISQTSSKAVDRILYHLVTFSRISIMHFQRVPFTCNNYQETFTK